MRHTTARRPGQSTTYSGERRDICHSSHFGYFRVDSEDQGYTLHIGGYSGTAGDSLYYSNGMKFSTFDKDNDKDNGNCADFYKGAWWFKRYPSIKEFRKTRPMYTYFRCFQAHLNGEYYSDTMDHNRLHGIVWKAWLGYAYSLKASTMMIMKD